MGNLSCAVTYLISWGDGKGITVYGFLIALAILQGALFGWLLARKRGYPADTVIDIVLWSVPLAIVGARLYYVIFTAIGEGRSWGFGEIFAVWDGGLAVYGGVLFAILGCFLLSIYYSKRRKKPDSDGAKAKPDPSFFEMADLGAPFLILGQAIGRIGCYFSECCYGNVVTNPSWQWLPFAVQTGGEWHLATFFFESAWCLIGLAIMLYFSLGKEKKWKFTGFVFAFYLMFYGLGRFVLEFLRVDSSETLWLIPGKLPASMAVAVVMFLWGAYIMVNKLFLSSKKNRSDNAEKGRVY